MGLLQIHIPGYGPVTFGDWRHESIMSSVDLRAAHACALYDALVNVVLVPGGRAAITKRNRRRVEELISLGYVTRLSPRRARATHAGMLRVVLGHHGTMDCAIVEVTQ